MMRFSPGRSLVCVLLSISAVFALGSRVPAQEPTLESLGCPHILIGVSHDLADYQNFLKLYAAAKEIGGRAHAAIGQRYAGRPYSYHLGAVDEVLRRFGYDPRFDPKARALSIGAWLHDTEEDTGITNASLRVWFGDDIALLVESVTKEKPRPGESPRDTKRRTLLKPLLHPLGPDLKSCDRTGNVEQGVKEGGVLQKYVLEYPAFRESLKTPDASQSLWEHLDYLIESVSHAAGFSAVGFWTEKLAGLTYHDLKVFTRPFSEDEKARILFRLPRIDEGLPTDRDLPIENIHFMKRYCRSTMRNAKDSVVQAAHRLRSGYRSVDDEFPLTVWKDISGKIWTLDHRRLAAYRLAGNITRVSVRWASPEAVRAEANKFNPLASGSTIEVVLPEAEMSIILKKLKP